MYSLVSDGLLDDWCPSSDGLLSVYCLHPGPEAGSDRLHGCGESEVS